MQLRRAYATLLHRMVGADQSGNLDLTLDPKLMYAIKNPQLFPLEINYATYNQLLRVPGIGPTSAERILKVRRQFRLTTSDQLKNLGVVTKRASYYVTINGKHFTNLNWLCNPRPEQFQQLSLWGGFSYMILFSPQVSAILKTAMLKDIYSDIAVAKAQTSDYGLFTAESVLDADTCDLFDTAKFFERKFSVKLDWLEEISGRQKCIPQKYWDWMQEGQILSKHKSPRKKQ